MIDIIIFYNTNFQLMLKRRSTLDNKQKIKRNRITQDLIQLDKCLQISVDDRLLIRNKIKQEDPQLYQIFQFHKKEKNYSELQVKLRKMIVAIKGAEKRIKTHCNDGQQNKRIYSQNSQNNSYRNSLKSSPQKQKQPKKATIYFDISQLHKKIRQSHINNLNKQKSLTQIQRCSSKMSLSINVTNKNEAKSKPHKEYEEGKVLSQRRQTQSKSKLINKSSNSNNDKQNCSPQRHDKTKQINKIKTIQSKISDINFNQNNISYSSNIKSILMNKIKEKKPSQYSQANSKILKQSNYPNSNIITPQNQDNYTPIKQNYTQNIYQNFQLNTISKKPAKPIQRDQLPQLPAFTHETESFPMYIKASSREGDNQYTHTKLKELGYNDYRFAAKKERRQVLQTSIYVQQQSKFGQFYKRIKQVIQNDV